VTPPPGRPALRPRLFPALRRRRLTPEAADPWARPPERPTRYGLLARVSDMVHGWLDGRRGLPHLPQAAAEPVPLVAVEPGDGAAAADSATVMLSAPVPEPAPTGRLSWLMSPRIAVLSAWAQEQFKAEELAYWNDCAALMAELQRYRATQDGVAVELAGAKERLELAQRPLTDQDRRTRRLAEQVQSGRPESFVAERRQAEWDRRLRAAEGAYQAAVTRHAEAARHAQLCEELIRFRLAVARAAARRHHEFALRRIATYQQQLVRRHRRGADLNLLIMSHPVGPELPAWTTDPDATPGGGGRWTSQPYLGEEGSNP
jgi:hypothetical protein